MPSQLLSAALLVAHWLIVGGLFVRILMRRTPIGVAVAWLAVVAAAPFVGATLYLLFGERRLGRRRAATIAACRDDMLRWQATLRQRCAASDADAGAVADPIRRHADRSPGFPALGCNVLELLHDAPSVFAALIADIDRAERRCHLCSYIWQDGGRVGDLIDALVRAAARGVECRALADAIGSKAFLASAAADRMRRAGVQLVAALPTSPLRAFLVRRDLRNHRKIAVIDDRVAYTGSQNLVDPRFFRREANVGEWIDAIVRITGPAAAALDGVFALDWTVETGEQSQLPGDVDGDAPAVADGALVQVVPSGPDLEPEAIHQLLLTTIYAARRELILTTPYFVPSESIQTALLSAALRGVDVTVIVPARNDSALVRFASAAHFDDLLAAGAKVALFDGGLLHTKSLTVDGELSVFGSVNLDMRSLWLNFEISLFVYHGAFTDELRALQQRYLAVSRLLDRDAWQRRPRRRRFAENACRLLGPLL